LVRHLVLEHLDEGAPAMLEQQAAGELDGLERRQPLTEAARRISEAKYRAREPPTEEQPVETAVLGPDRAQRERLELRAERA
jgi:hypothetical protein